MRQSYGIIEIVLAIILLGLTFCSLPKVSYYFNIICILVILIFFILKNRYARRVCKERITSGQKIDTIEDMDVYVLDYEEIGSHNVLILQGEESVIAIEKEVMSKLTDEERRAVLLHECGHSHTFSQQHIYILQILGVALSAVGLHLLLNGEKYIVCVIGIAISLGVEFLKRYVECEADKYAVKRGCGKDNLISAITKIEGMNEKNTRIKTSGHPDLQARIKKIGVEENGKNGTS